MNLNHTTNGDASGLTVEYWHKNHLSVLTDEMRIATH